MAQGKSNNSLHEFAREGNADAVRGCLSSCPDSLNARDKLSRAPLHLAAWAGQAEVVRVLCDASADVGAAALDDMSALHFACQKGHTDVVRILLAAGAHVNAKNRKGMTALHFAVQGERDELAKLLIKKGASLSLENKGGKTPVDLVQNESFRDLVRSAELERDARRAKKKSGVKDKVQASRGAASDVEHSKLELEDEVGGHITVSERPSSRYAGETNHKTVAGITGNPPSSSDKQTQSQVEVIADEFQNGQYGVGASMTTIDVPQRPGTEDEENPLTVSVQRTKDEEVVPSGKESKQSSRKKAKVSLSHLAFDRDDDDEINN